MKRTAFKLSHLFILFLLFLPFTKALTLDIGFPLKISELVLGALILVFFVKLTLSYKISSTSVINVVLVIFLFWTTISFFINSLWKYEYDLKEVPFRINPFFDNLLKLIYIYLSAIAFFVSSFFLKNTKQLQFWLKGAIVVSVYSWYLFLSSGLNLPYIKLFGMDENPQNLFGFIRCGTFSEGNFFGLYLLLSIAISFYIKHKKTAVFLIITTITTFSTVALVSLSVFLLYVFRKTFFNKKIFTYPLILSPLIVLAFIMAIKSPYFQNHIYNKLTQPSNELSSNNISKVDRTLTARIAFKQGLNNPFFGVGPYNYGLHYDQYNDFDTYIKNNSSWSEAFFRRIKIRAIPNNVYLEIWAEYGIVGFSIFMSFLFLLFKKTCQSKNRFIIGGIIALLISLNACPSFVMQFIWVFFAIPIAINNNKELE